MKTVAQVKKALQEKASKERAEVSKRFFKTGKGEYGEGDQFIGVRVPEQRTIAQLCLEMPLGQVVQLLQSSIHEHRLTAVLIMTYQFKKADEDGQRAIYDAYLQQSEWVNNWDIVDSSAHKIVGAYLSDRKRQPLYDLAWSPNLWEKRIAIIATLWFIKQGDFTDTLALAELFLKEEHDLMHKAVGWMLREMGKVDPLPLHRFLDQHAHVMPRTMLRYAIERLSKSQKKQYMEARKGSV
jgi:3-methyladenine DNA glycosylase AlkD